jgi:tagatose-1,6-bisphosphate aldolase
MMTTHDNVVHPRRKVVGSRIMTTTRASVQDISHLGKLRRLQRISDPDGFIRVAAIDHPENYQILFDTDLSRVTDEEVVLSKLELIAAMSAECTAVLLDPVWSYGQAVLSQAVPAGVGIVSGLEHLAYSPEGFGTETALREGWTVPVLARLGTDGAKLVVFYRAELADVSATQFHLVEQLVEECAREQLPLVVEPLWYPLDGESLDDPAVRAARVEAIVESARVFADLGADVMKMEFPGYLDTDEDRARAAEACRRLDDAIDVPWVLLSASATFEQFRTQVAIAAGAGACGFMAGRAIWGDGVGRHDRARREEGARTAAARLRELHETLSKEGRGWHRTVSAADTLDMVPRDWFRES